jgi:dCTP deaminase
MFLSDSTIRKLIASGHIGVDPFDEHLVQPASLDCRLGNEFRRMLPSDEELDVCRGDAVTWDATDVPDGEPFTLQPGGFVLGHTKEAWNFPPDVLGFLDGKSSLGRIGLLVHVTAGFCDPGFQGQLTLELSNINTRDIILRPGMPIAQMTFALLDKPSERPYGTPGLGSRYQGQVRATSARVL